MTSAYDFDLFVIGAGSGGVRASRMAAAEGKRVAVAEDRYLGGTCVNVGCVPKKLYVYASNYARGFEESKGFGFNPGDIEFDWATLRDNKKAEISRLNGIYSNMLVNAGCTLLNGKAVITDAHTVSVNGETYTAERILVATGGWPFIPEFPGREHVLSSNEIFDLDELPKTMVIVGGGYIAVEFAGIFAGLGIEVTLINRSETILKGFDNDVQQFVTQEIKKQGIELKLGFQITEAAKSANGVTLTLDNGETLETGLVLYATGRKPKTAGLGLEEVGVKLAKNGAIEVDTFYQSSVPSIYAIGDVIDRVQLTPVALAEGMKLVKHWYYADNTPLDYSLIPTAVFCQPNVGTVGLTEEQAIATYGKTGIRIFRSDFRAMKHTLSGSEQRTLMKLIVETTSDRVVGIHMAGDDAGEIIQGMAVALKAGATKAVFDATIGIHPTAAEEFVTMRTPVTE